MRLLFIFLSASILNAQAPANRRNFVACPMVRDTKTTPCWLAEYQGETYFLGVQGGVVDDFYPPQLSHEVLVEGTIVEGPRVCGGIPLRPVKLSVLQEVTAACSLMLPAEDGIDPPASLRPPRPGPAPSWVKAESPDRTAIYFDFNQDFLNFHTTTALANIAATIKQGGPARIEITGYQGATLLSSGDAIREEDAIGDVRARKVAGILLGLGVPHGSVSVLKSAGDSPPDGVNDQWSRRVMLVVKH